MVGWKCQRNGCSERAEVFPIIYFWPLGHQDRSKRVALPAIFALPICGPCSTACEMNDFLSDPGFERICGSVVAVGMAEPDRASARLEFKRLDQFRDFAPKESGLSLPPEDWTERPVKEKKEDAR